MVQKVIASMTILVWALATMAATKPNFSGVWIMDRDRSFGLPGNMNQTMQVTQTGDQIELETKLIQPDNERIVKDTYILDGKEHEFTPQPAPGQTSAKGKRTAYWLPGDQGIVVDEVTTSETAKRTVTNKVTRKWTMTAEDELTIAMYFDGPNGSFEAKRIFKKR